MILYRTLFKRSFTTTPPPTRIKLFTIDMLKENGPALLGIITIVGTIVAVVRYVDSLEKEIVLANERINNTETKVKASETNAEAKIKASEASSKEAIAKAVLDLSFHGDYEKYRAWLSQIDKTKGVEPVQDKSK